MKRSEIVNAIVLLLKATQLHISRDVDYYSIADEILNIEEKAGMKPPFCVKLWNPHTDMPTGHEWENEDD